MDTLQLIEWDVIGVKKNINKENFKLVDEKTFLELEWLAQNYPQFISYIGPKNLQVKNYVGTLMTKNGLILEVYPKISRNRILNSSKKILIKLLQILNILNFKTFNNSSVSIEKITLFEIFIKLFLEEVENLVRKGIKNGYVLKQDNQNYLKGKLLVSKHIIKNIVNKSKFFIEWSEYLSDRIENKIIKYTLKFLQSKTANLENFRKIKQLLTIFDEVDIKNCNFKKHFPKLNLDRTMNYYAKVLKMCEIFLANKSYSIFKGDNLIFSLLFDMNKLFEMYVYYLIKKENKNAKVIFQDSKYYLFEKEKKFRLRPDIVLIKNFNGEKQVKIIDAKWKEIDSQKNYLESVTQSDLYQLITYAAKYENVNEIVLVYPNINDNKNQTYTDLRLFNKNFTLEIKFINLEQLLI